MKTSNDTQLLNVLVSPLEAMIINLIPVPAHPETTFDDDAFRSAVARSASLAPEEKVAFIEAVPTFTQKQIERLLAILTEEAEELDALSRAVLAACDRHEAKDEALVRRGTFTVIRGGQA
jgi:hypothetical protein